jgi:hypothetical protein
MAVKTWLAGGLIVTAIAAGSAVRWPAKKTPLSMGGYQVLAADFHIHVFPMNWTTLPPWDIVREVEREQLDVAAIVGHNHLWISQFAKWFSERTGGPRILVGEEIVTHKFHVVGVGLREPVSWDQTAAGVIAAIHRQGGVAIAAHPVSSYWPGYDEAAMRQLDATEVLHPDGYGDAQKYEDMRRFYLKKRLTAIGDSDFHSSHFAACCRTYVFVHDNTEAEILQALREGRTVVYGRNHDIYGDPSLIQLAAQDGRLPLPLPGEEPLGWLVLFSRYAGALGLLIALFSGFVPR